MTRQFEDSWYLRFHGLMPFRVRQILLVSSPYDAFTMEEDGHLMTRLFHQYSELNLSELPTIIRAHDAGQAFSQLRQRRFDLVITMTNVGDRDVDSFTKSIKDEFPDMPIVLFAFTDTEVSTVPSRRQTTEFPYVDRVFLWTGDAHLLIAAIKVVEDQRNVAHDTVSGVRVILVVEDSVRFYSNFISLLYVELLRQGHSLISEGINDLHRSMLLRSRPKVILTSRYEDAIEYYRAYQHNVLAVISDVRYPKGNGVDREAGFKLAEEIRSDAPDMPILIQSADPGWGERAERMGVVFCNKNSPHLLRQIRLFLREDVGFGDFVFRTPDRTEVGRAQDLYEMERILPVISDESLEYHARHNHFSTWLMARGVFMLARELRPRRADEFESMEALRQHLLSVLRKARRLEHTGAISDFSPRYESDRTFLRIGSGSIGGKGRAIAFVNSTLRPQRLADRFDNLKMAIPKTVAIGTDEFERFLEHNDLAEVLETPGTDEEIRRRFLSAQVPPELVRPLTLACSDLSGPLSVRSSSILEDSRQRPFAGIYSTFMLPNNHPDPDVRLHELQSAVKAVYASTYCAEARSYVTNTPYTIEEERMGVAIQQLVGRRFGDRFYPASSGVAQSCNFYPVAGQLAEEGVAAVVVGLGTAVVEGGRALQFSPARPRVLPQFSCAQDFLSLGQRQFLALDMSKPLTDFVSGRSNLISCPLSDAEADGVLRHMGSVYSPADDAIRDNLRLPGPRVVTFNNILRWQTVPLAAALRELLETMQVGFGQEVEIEFAVDLDDSARGILYVLQVRPQAGTQRAAVVAPVNLSPDAVLCRTDVSLGNGVFQGIRDIIYVKRDFLEHGGVRAAAEEIGALNEALKERRYMLIGPGRWGSSDPHLGIPVVWSQISGAQIIVETIFEGRSVEPSQGSHFFHNVLSLQLGYLTLSTPQQKRGRAAAELDLDWLDAHQAANERPTVRHIVLDAPVTAYLNGRDGSAVVLKPRP